MRSRCCAGATRASTSGSSSTSSPTRCRSGATCWRAASWPRWWSPTPCCASSRACSARTSRPWRSRSRRRWRAASSTRITRDRRTGAAGACPRCCSPATMSASANGAGSRVANVRYHDLPACRRPFSRLAPRSFFAMSTVIDSLERQQLRRVPNFAAGDRVRVHFQVIEGTRRRTQVFEGVVIKRQGEGVRETFTVRKNSFGVGVERTFPVHSPKIERIEVAARGDVRRAKLYYLRGRVGKRARVRERRYTGPEEVVQAGLLHDPAAEAAAAQDAEVPGEAVDEQALAQAEAAEVEASAEAEGAAAAESAGAAGSNES